MNEVPMNIRVYLSVPFKDKDYAKELGCRWDSGKKKWYCIDSNHGKSKISEAIKIWNNPEPYKIINDKIVVLSNLNENQRGFTTF